MRVLCLLGRNSEDVTRRCRFLTGAALALQTSGCNVRLLGTTATEHADPIPPLERLRRAGVGPRLYDARSGGRLRPEFHFSKHGIPHRLVDVGTKTAWEGVHGVAFDSALGDEIASQRPDVVLTDLSVSVRRLRCLRKAGIPIVYAVSDAQPLDDQALALAEAILCPNERLADQHRAVCGTVPVSVLRPVVDAGAVPEVAQRECLTIVDPSIETGVYFLIRLCEEIGLRRPDLPVLVVASSAGSAPTARMMVKAGLAAGFDLRRHENMLFSEPASHPAELWAPARILLSPLLANAPIDLFVEALANGVPPLLGDRGGPLEFDAGRVLPLPLDFDLATRSPVAAVDVEPWLEAIEYLDDDSAFEAERQRALEAARSFLPGVLAASYRQFFERVLS